METEPLQGRDEDTVTSADFSNMLSEEEKEELKAELVQVCLVIYLFLICLSLHLESYYYFGMSCITMMWFFIQFYISNLRYIEFNK